MKRTDKVEYIVTVDTKKLEKQLKKATGWRASIAKMLFESAARVIRKKITVDIGIEQVK